MQNYLSAHMVSLTCNIRFDDIELSKVAVRLLALGYCSDKSLREVETSKLWCIWDRKALRRPLRRPLRRARRCGEYRRLILNTFFFILLEKSRWVS